MKRKFITYKGSVYDAIEIEAYKIDKEVTDEDVIYTICDFELWNAIEEDYMEGDKEAIDIDNQIYYYCDSGFCACSPTEEEVIGYFIGFIMNEKKSFTIDFDVTMGGSVEIMAENREEAERKFRERMTNNPYHYARKVENFVDYDIVDINEEEE